jgi:hypothetical protein
MGSLDPVRAAGRELLLPDRDGLLQRVDRETAGLERLGAVRRGGRDHHRGLADREPAHAVRERELHLRPARRDGVADLAHLLLRHGRVGLVLEVVDLRAARLVAHHAGERDHAAHLGTRDLGEQRVQRERPRVDPRALGAAGHGRQERELVAVSELRLERRALLVQRHQQLAAKARDHAVLALQARERLGERGIGRQLKLELLLAERFT